MIKSISGILYLWYQILFFHILACPFVNYEEGLLSALNPVSVETKVLALDSSKDGDSIAFGYWSFCIPLWEVQLYPTVKSQFQISAQENGQLFFLVQPIGNNEPIILGYLSFDSANLQVIHNINVEIPESNFLQYRFQYSSATYEGKWIFTLLTFLPQSSLMLIEMTDQQSKVIATDFIGISEVTFTIGGRGFITMNSLEYNLNIFRGRLSILIYEPQFSFDLNNFNQLSDNCKIPQKIIGEQTKFIVQGYQFFKGDSLLQFVIDQVGNRYCLSGWVKYDASQIVYQTIFTLVRISAFKNYQSNINFGDDMFYFQVQLEKQFSMFTQIVVYTNPYSIPLLGPIDYDFFTEYYHFANVLSDIQSDYYYEGLQQWHFMQYEYGRTVIGKKKMLLQIQFFNELGLIKIAFGSPRRVASFINSNFYLFFGGDDDALELLRASIYNFKFEYNYNYNKQFLFNVCHYSCLTCNGPLQNNCISCDSNSFRIFLSEQQVCQCLENYIDQEGNMICEQFTHEYASIEEKEIPAEYDSKCQSGYFYLLDSNKQSQCIKCPQNNFNDRLCVDCLYYQLTWFQKPLCTMDLVTRKENSDDAYTQVQRKSIDYDLYVIDEAHNVFLIEGAFDFCFDISQSNCHHTNYYHLGNSVNVLCKENYFFSQSKCLKADPQCLKSDSMGKCNQCTDGMYLKDNVCFECPLICLTCKYDDIIQQPICESCYERSTVVNGKCMECGSYCKICKYFEDRLLNSQYLRCYKCLDDSQFMLSLDGQNCLPNPITNCIYAFQALISDITINTLDYYFRPQEDSDDVGTYCGLCDRTYVWVTSTYECVEGFMANCDFGYANFPDFSSYTQICLVASQQSNQIIQFSKSCQGYSQNCGTCILGKPEQFYQLYVSCLICSAGYYSEKQSGKCYKCPEDLHCYQCIQQDSFSKDSWKDNIRAFYRQFIEENYLHPYILYGQSQNQNDYEVICSMCQPNYEFLGDKCIPSCPESCLECQQINGENICLKCQAEKNGRRLSLINNQCIQCPKNCALCRQRSTEEIANINPLFQNKEFEFYTYQCLKSFSDIDYFYDQEIGQFIQCTNFVNGCQKQFVIPIKLFCSETIYNDELGMWTTQQEIMQFKRQNIFITDLFSGNSFSQFYNSEFYHMANDKLIKKIIIKIIGQEQQTCQISGASTITQSFSANIFSAIIIELEMIFEQNTLFVYDKNIVFENFKKVTISGLTLQPKNNNRLKQIVFQSMWPQSVYLNNIIYQQEADIDSSQIIFQELEFLLIENIQIKNLVQSDQNYFFFIEKTDHAKSVICNNVKISNCLISNQIMFFFNLGPDDKVTFQNVEIQSTFNNASLISSLDPIRMAQLNLFSFSLLILLKDCSSFLDLYRFQSVDIKQFLLKASVITNSTFFNLNTLAQLSGITMADSSFTISSTIIFNSDLLLYNSFKISFNNIKFEKNIYDETSKLISLKKYDSESSEIEITQFYLIGNSASFISKEINSDSISSSLVFIQFSVIKIFEMNIQRGYGLIDISIFDAQKVSLDSIKITQHFNFVFLGLHQYLDCQLKQVQGQSYWHSVFIYQTKKVQITNIEISGIEIYNQPLIMIQSADLAVAQQKESIEIQNLLVKSNLLLLTDLTKQTTLFKILSAQEISLVICKAQFQDNILHEYVQNQVTDSTALLLIDFSKGSVSILDSYFYNNLVTNGTDSILRISSNQIKIQNSEFTNNSIFNYKILYPYLLWGFHSSQKIYISNIISIFPVQSKSGNGLLRGVMIEISQTKVTGSSGSFGGGFQITAQNQASISLINCVFTNINSLFSAQDESGGVIYFDGSNAQSFIFRMENISTSNINCRYQGGLLYIQAGLAKANVQLQNISAKDVYSSYGSILFLEFSNLATSQQKLVTKGLHLKNTYKGHITFLNKFINQQSTSEISILINNRTAIFVNYGDVLIFQNITMQNLLLESAFYLSNAIKISIVEYKASNFSSSKNLINIIANTQFDSYYIISHFIAVDSQVGEAIFFNQCSSFADQNKEIYFQCLTNPKSPPLFLEEDQNLDQDDCIRNNMNIMQDLSNSGLIIFTQLNVLNQLKLDSITLQNINCKNCQQGLIAAMYTETESTLSILNLESITISQSQCGKSSCMIFSNGQIVNSRILQRNQIYQLGFELIIKHYDCIKNIAVNGTCLMVSNLKTLITESNFKENTASLSGGSIYVKGSKLFMIEQSIISDNTAYQGGGYFSDQLLLNLTNYNTVIENNKATFYGDDKVSSPTQMTVSFNGTILSTQTIERTEILCIDQVKINSYIQDQIENALYLPTGQEVNNYQYYDWKQSIYIPLKWQFRLMALNQEKTIQKNLLNTQCSIQSRVHKNNSHEPFLNNYTNFQIIQFNDSTQDYNLDNLIIYFNSDSASDLVLQLQFSCSSIKIPIYNKEFPYNILNYHSNYYLRLNVRSFSCQLGEIKQNDSCVLCDSSQGLFSVEPNSVKCNVLEDISTISVKPAQLNIKQGFWRPYLDTSLVSYCLNLKTNCLGGWIEGDNSCYLGHIGALCEQCDLYNTRGEGSFSISTSYSCGTCEDMVKNAFLIGVISIWTLITILISVKSTLKAIEQCVRIITLLLLGIAVCQETSQLAILIKMLTNFLQILATISTFQLSIPVGIDKTITAAGNPIQTIAYSLDCMLIQMFDFEIHYARMIWQLILPYLYIVIFLFGYLLGVKVKLLEYNASVLTTTLIYMYIYLQPNLVGGLVQLISFRKISGFSWIQANVSYRYDTTYHLQWLLQFCLPLLLIIALLIPLYMFKGLYSYRDKLDDKTTRLKWGYLYNEYKKDAYFWEIVKIVEKELIIIFLTYYQDNIVIKGILIQIIVFIYYQLNKKYSPYSLKTLNQLDSQSAQICMISIALGVGIYISQGQGLLEIQIPFFFLLTITNVQFLFKIIIKIIMGFIREGSNKNESKLDVLRDKIRDRFPFLQSIPFFKRLLANRTAQRNRNVKLYRKLKQFLIPQAKQILAFKEYQRETAISQFMDSPYNTFRSPRASAEKQRFLRNNIRLSSLSNKKSFSSYILDKMKVNKIDQMAAIFEAGEKNENLPQSSKVPHEIQKSSNEKK